MSDYVCVIQEGQAADQRREALTEGMKNIGAECFGADPAAIEVGWVPVRKGFGWTAGEPSKSSVIDLSVAVGLSQDQRVDFMKKICDLWVQETGCSSDKILILTWDGPLPAQL